MRLGTEVGLGPGHIVLDGDPAPPTERGTAALPTFRPMSIVAKRSPISAITELLLEFSAVLRLAFFAQHCFTDTVKIAVVHVTVLSLENSS